jgi:hypothetical protein
MRANLTVFPTTCTIFWKPREPGEHKVMATAPTFSDNKNHATQPGNDSSTCDSDETSDVTQRLECMSISQAETTQEHFRFFELPAEIRDMIYSFTYTLSRDRGEIYRIPDFIVHGDGRNKGGIRWMNIERYNLLLVCKQTFNESMPIIAAESFFEIKTYVELDKKARNTIKVLRNPTQLCHDAGKVVIDLTPGHTYKAVPLCHRIFEIVTVLDGYKKLKEITLKILVSELREQDLSGMAGFFGLAKKGITLLIELGVYDYDWADGYWNKAMRKRYEKAIHRLTKNFGGKNAEVSY